MSIKGQYGRGLQRCGLDADISGYYDGATELYEYGWAESFHFSRFYKGEAFLQSVRIFSVLSRSWRDENRY